MRFALAVATVALVAAAVVGQHCHPPTGIDPFKPSACPAYGLCDATFCSCVGASNSSTNASTCLSTSAATCQTIQACLANYTRCLIALESQRASTDAACNATGTIMHAATLAAAVDSYNGSTLQQGCRQRVCHVMNASRVHPACDFGVNDSRVCGLATSAPRYVVRVQLRLSGSAYAALLNNPAHRASLENALKTDIAGLLDINAQYVVILNLALGSLIVDFAVVEGSGKSPAALDTAIQSATNNTNWLRSTKSVYAVVSNETITVLGVTVTEAGGTTRAPAGPGPNPATTSTAAPNPPAGTSAFSGASAISVAAAAVVAVLGLALAL